MICSSCAAIWSGEHALVALGLIELLRCRGLLVEQATGAGVGTPGDFVLRRQRVALGPGRVALGDTGTALRLERGDLLPHFVDARSGRRLLRGQLIALEAELRRVDGGRPPRQPATTAPSVTVYVTSRPAASAPTTTSVASTLP